MLQLFQKLVSWTAFLNVTASGLQLTLGSDTAARRACKVSVDGNATISASHVPLQYSHHDTQHNYIAVNAQPRSPAII